MNRTNMQDIQGAANALRDGKQVKIQNDIAYHDLLDRLTMARDAMKLMDAVKELMRDANGGNSIVQIEFLVARLEKELQRYAEPKYSRHLVRKGTEVAPDEKTAIRLRDEAYERNAIYSRLGQHDWASYWYHEYHNMKETVDYYQAKRR